MQLFSAEDRYNIFKKKKNCLRNVEKTTLKSCSGNLKSTFLLTVMTVQPAQKEFMFQNVAYWPTVYRTGGITTGVKNHNLGNFIEHTAFLLLGAVTFSCWMALHALVISGLGFDFFFKLVWSYCVAG